MVNRKSIVIGNAKFLGELKIATDTLADKADAMRVMEPPPCSCRLTARSQGSLPLRTP